MLTHSYFSYIYSDNSTFTESEIKPLIIRVFQIVSSFLKSKTQQENYTTKQIEEEAIDLTAQLCMENGKGTPQILERIERQFNKIESLYEFEYLLFRAVCNKIKNIKFSET